MCLGLSAIPGFHQYLYLLFTDIILCFQVTQNTIICAYEIASVNTAGADQIIFWEMVFAWFMR